MTIKPTRETRHVESGIKIDVLRSMVLKKDFPRRDPKDGERLAVLIRQQLSGGSFAVYSSGDYLIRSVLGAAGQVHREVSVIVLAGPQYYRSEEGWKSREQIVILRSPTTTEAKQIAVHEVAQEAESKRVLQRMMDR